ncbi:hypothetical protein MLD52_04605 [Puniceicoccaceae bacterium K14]|nr:hypothetical protein [Puniceicoccaceae bacterium K14]
MKRDKNFDALLEKMDLNSATRIVWKNSLVKADSCGMGVDLIEAISGSFKFPSSLDALCYLVSEDPIYEGPDSFASVWERFAELHDDSNYDQMQLLQSLELILIYIREQSMKTKLSTVLGYLICSEEFAYGSADNRKLAEVVRAMLDDFGFDG